MKKILFFITSLAGGGAEKVLVNMVNHMDYDKYDITVQTLFDEGINKQYLNKNVHYKYVWKKTFRGNIHFLKIFSPEFLYKKFIREKYDIVVSYFQGATTRIIGGCTDKNTKLVQWVHNEFHSKNEISKCYRSIKECEKLQRRFDASVFVAESVKQIYMNTFPDSTKNNIVLYNVVESDRIKQLSLKKIAIKNLYDADFTLISVGRLVPQKAFDRLIEIIAQLKKENYNVKLLLLGCGYLEKNLKEKCHTLKIENEVIFLGYRSNPYKYIKRADLFVCSSLHEGFSTAVTEALIVGTPVVTTMCSGMIELLGNNEYGLIVNNDGNALYEGILRLLNDKSLLYHYKKKAKERGEKFSLEKTVKKAEDFFDSL